MKSSSSFSLGVSSDSNSRKSGFIALFFVLTTASFLTMLIYGLSRSFEYTLIMLSNFRSIDNSRASALYCKYKLYNNVLLNPEYHPVIGVNVGTPLGTACQYKSFRKVSSQIREVFIVGRSASSQYFIIKYTYIINTGLHDYVGDISTVQILSTNIVY